MKAWSTHTSDRARREPSAEWSTDPAPQTANVTEGAF